MTLLHEELERKVLERIRPTPEEYRLRDEIFSLVKRKIEDELAKNDLEGEVTLQGSARKGTWLRNNLELDVFVLFPPHSKEWLREVAFPVLLNAVKSMGFPYELRFAEHPYVRLYVKGIPVEVVPAFKVKRGEVITAVDRTPFHTEWVLEKVKELGERILDEIRLLKAFFKGVGVYGAEIEVQGFSGYATEVLVIHYGGFKETMEAMSAWRPPVVVNARKEILKRFPDAQVVLIDPVDPKRNVTAAVSSHSLGKAILAANRYIHKPKEAFFFKEIRESYAQAKLPVYVIEIPVRPAPPETLWGELLRLGKSLINNLKKMEFKVTRWKAFLYDSFARIAVEVLEDVLPEFRIVRGPPVWLKNANAFLDKHVDAIVWVEDYRIYSVIPREIRRVDEAIMKIISSIKVKTLDTERAKISKIEVSSDPLLVDFLKGREEWM